MYAYALRDLFSGASCQELLVSAKPGWSAFNPSIAHSPTEGYQIIVRSSNYTMDKQGRYNVRDPGGVIRTRNFIGILDSALDVVDLQPIESPGWGEVLFPLVRGLEDARLYWAHDHWQVYGTLREHRYDGLCQIATARLEHGKLIDPQLYPHPFEGRPEKNWMVINEGPDFLYSCNPVALIHDGEWKGLVSNDQDQPSKEFRGGGQLVPWSRGLLGIVHEVDWTTGHRRYFQRFTLHTYNGTLTGYTEPFYCVFDHMIEDEPMIEYAAGLVIHGSDIVVSFGYKDSRCFLARIPQAEIAKKILTVQRG